MRNSTRQENEAWALNVPIASGNNVALINTGDQHASAGTKQEQTNVNVTKQSADQSSGGGAETWSSDCRRYRSYERDVQTQSVRNSTRQENEAWAFNVPILSGNNLALVNTGDQSAFAGTTQRQFNGNVTWQQARQVD